MVPQANILVVDDEESIRFCFQKFLSDEGFKVDAVDNAHAAIERLRNNDYEVAVVDRILPDSQNGVDIIKQLSMRQPHCKTILISAHPSFESAAETLNYSAFAYLTKPIGKQTICDTVANAARASKEARNRKHHEALFHSLFDASPIPIAICDLDGRARFINRAFAKTFGYSSEELRGGPIPFVPEWDLERTRTDIRRARAGEIVPERETQRISKQSEIIDVTLSISLAGDEDGDPSDILIMLRDITESKTLEGLVLQAQKMEAIGTLAGGIAHDFNNLLHVISGNNQLLMLDVPREHPWRRKLSRIEAATESGTRLVRQLLDLRNGEPATERTNINRIIHNIEGLLQSSIPSHIHLKIDLDDHLDMVEVDPNQIEQALINLCLNARDAIEAKINDEDYAANAKAQANIVTSALPSLSPDRITLRTESVRLDEAMCRTSPVLKPGHYVRISVSDTGTGISAQIRYRIFEPFFSTKNGKKGRGLGLAMVYRIVKRHKGEIILFSEVGVGSTFNMLLPVPADAEILSDVSPGKGR